MALLLSLCLVAGLMLIISWLMNRAQETGGTVAEKRMRALIEGELDDLQETQEQNDTATQPGLAERIVKRVADKLTRSDALASDEGRNLISWLDEQLILAGLRDRFNPYEALGVLLTCTVAGAAAFLLLWGIGMPIWLGAVLMIVLVIYPPAKLVQLKNRRRNIIDSELAFFIMELVMALSSGRTNLDDALLRVARNNATSPSAPLAREFELACTEYRVGGKDRELALMDIVRRTRNEGVEALVDALIATLKTGSDPLHALREQSEQARRLRKQALRTFTAKQRPKTTLGMMAEMVGGVILLGTPLVIGVLDAITGF